MTNRKGICPDCGCRVLDPLPRDPNFFALCVDCGSRAITKSFFEERKKEAMPDYKMRVSEVTDPKDTPRKLTEAEIDKLSTDEERAACARYRALQLRCIETGSMGETDLLIASEAIGILVARNKRLGLIK